MAALTLSSMVPKVSSAGIISTIVWVFFAVIVFVCIILWIYIHFQKKKFAEYRIVIYEKDSTGNTHEYYDQGGIFINKKTGLKLLWLKRFKKGLDPNKVPYVTAKDGKGRLVKTVYLIRTGVSNFRFLHVKIEGTIPKFTIGEEDINWASQELEAVKKTYLKKNLLEQLLPIAVFIIIAIIIMIILITLFGKIGIIKEATANLERTSANQIIINEQLKNITEQWTRISGGGGPVTYYPQVS